MKALSLFMPALLVALTACQPQQTQQQQPTQTQQPTQPNVSANAPHQAVKVVTPDWAIASTLTAMGYPPLAVGDVKTYPEWVGKPELPSQVIDLGERFAPNPERLAQLKPDVIIDNDFYAHLRPLYGDTPHTAISFVPKGEVATWQDYAKPTQQLGDVIHQPQQAEQFLTQSKQRLGELGKAFKQKHPNIKNIAIVQFADANNLRIYTNNSLFKPTFDIMGLNLITLENQLGKGNLWGFLPITLGDLAKLDNSQQDTCIAVVEPFSPMLRQQLTDNLLWQRLGYGRTQCMTVLPPIWLYGGVSSMLTFGERLNKAEFQGGIANVK
ncbi:MULTISPECIES: ABC transporter substrate-binding protein [unclassified Moraxella]|uniref:ABC transporter substrate-binding protein n=1 Tax=unclassified Moraxella TaxID=2685852 RepID=UPI003AF70877